MKQLNTSLLITLLVIIWGFSPLISKKIYRSGINPITNMLFNTSFYLLAILIVAYFNRKIVIEDIHKLDKNVLAMQFIFALCFMFMGNYINNYLIKHNDPSYITSMTSVSPVVTLIASYYLLNEPLTTNKIMGVVSIAIGVYFLNKKK